MDPYVVPDITVEEVLADLKSRSLIRSLMRLPESFLLGFP